jgi:hypothetical protein
MASFVTFRIEKAIAQPPGCVASECGDLRPQERRGGLVWISELTGAARHRGFLRRLFLIEGPDALFYLELRELIDETIEQARAGTDSPAQNRCQ